MHSIEYTVEELDMPIDISQPWLGFIPTVLQAVVTIEGNAEEWRVTAVNIQTTLGKEACFTNLKRYGWANYHPMLITHVQAMLSVDQSYCDDIAEEFEERRCEGREYEKELH